MKAEVLVKHEHILEAAIKRFSHFGVSKTTLTDIADDLAISKTVLFYYFNDKNSLVTAVAGKIINEFLDGYETAIQAAGSVEEAILSMIEVKREYFKKYFLLAIQGDSMDNKLSSTLPEIYLQARAKTKLLISNLLKKGVEQKMFRSMDTEKTSDLLLETLSAFEHCIKGRNAIPEMKDIDELFNKQKEVLRMMINGLKQ